MLATARALALAVCVPAAAAQTPVLFELTGDASEDEFGRAVARLGDLNNDGFPDLAVGAPLFDAPDPGGGALLQDSGEVVLLSGFDGTVLGRLFGDAPGDAFGFAIGALPDLDHDGFPDLVVGAPVADAPGATDGGLVRAVSGATLATLFSVRGEARSALGFAVMSAGDVDADGTSDVIAGAPLFGPASTGGAAVLSGASGAQLLVFAGSDGFGFFGQSVAGVGDANGDGVPDVAVGAPFADGAALDSGTVTVYSGVDGSVIAGASGDAAGDALGFSIARLGDIDGDGFDELVAGAPGADVKGPNTGRVRVLATGSGAALRDVDGPAAEAQLGFSVAGAGDLNGDGRPDFIAGAPFASNQGLDRNGRARAYSGATGTPLATVNGTVARGLLGFAVTGGLGATFTAGAPEVGTGGRGRARVFAGAEPGVVQSVGGENPGDRQGSTFQQAGDIDQDGAIDFLAAAIGAEGPARTPAAGRVLLVSGTDGQVLVRLDSGSPQIQPPLSAGGRFGTAAATGIDLDDDGLPDFAVGAPGERDDPAAPVGRVVVFRSAQKGSHPPPLYSQTLTIQGGDHGAAAGEEFGRALALLQLPGGDDDDDDDDDDDSSGGETALLVGTPAADVRLPGGGVLQDAGRVQAFDEAGKLLFTLEGQHAGDELGFALASLGDVDGDGVSDFAAGEPGFDAAGADAGRVRVFGGPGGAPLFELVGPAGGDRYGFALAALGDRDGDGFADLLVGAPQPPGTDPVAPGPGFADVVSGRTATVDVRLFGDAPGDQFGFDVDRAPGFPRQSVVIGAPFADSPTAANTGALHVVPTLGAASTNPIATVVRLVRFGEREGDRFGSSVTGIDAPPPLPTGQTAAGDCGAGGGAPGDDDNGDDSGEGDVVIDEDKDADGVPDLEDNCPNVPNPDQEDANLDGTGDECESLNVDTPCLMIGGGGSSADGSALPRVTFQLRSSAPNSFYFLVASGTECVGCQPGKASEGGAGFPLPGSGVDPLFLPLIPDLTFSLSLGNSFDPSFFPGAFAFQGGFLGADGLVAGPSPTFTSIIDFALLQQRFYFAFVAIDLATFGIVDASNAVEVFYVF